jgi:hypothetical protein
MAGGIRYRLRKPKPVRPTEAPVEPPVEAHVPVEPMPDVEDGDVSVPDEPDGVDPPRAASPHSRSPHGLDADEPPPHD